jgi:hypothetical protein
MSSICTRGAFDVRVTGDTPGSTELCASLDAQRDAVYAQLDMDGPGWAVIQGAFAIPEGFAEQVRAETDSFGYPIFQSNATHFPARWGDGRRLQADLSAGDDQWLGFSRALARFIDMFFPGRTNNKLDSIVSLLSRPDCGPQAPHADYHPDPMLWQPDCSASKNLPLGMVIGLENNTTIRVWSGSHRHIRDFVAGGCTADAATLPPIPVTIASFNAGDAFVFRPDVIHAGDSFDDENVRSHCYLDTATLAGFTRRTNGTFIPSDAVGERLTASLSSLNSVQHVIPRLISPCLTSLPLQPLKSTTLSRLSFCLTRTTLDDLGRELIPLLYLRR